MTDTTATLTETPSAEDSPNLFQRTKTRFPRTTKVVAITGATVGALAVAIVANTARKNKGHLSNAGDLLLEAGQEVATTVSPTDSEN
jgi:hypothetical protein